MANEYVVTAVAAEVLNNSPAKARVAQVAIEVLRSVAAFVPAPPRRHQFTNLN